MDGQVLLCTGSYTDKNMQVTNRASHTLESMYELTSEVISQSWDWYVIVSIAPRILLHFAESLTCEMYKPTGSSA